MEDTSQTFNITVSGPSYNPTPLTVTFNYSGNPNVSMPLTGLIPGEYNVTEADPGDKWIVDPASREQKVDVTPYTGAEDECEEVTFTNTRKGEAEVIKYTDGVCDNTQDWRFSLNGPEVSVPSDTMNTTCHIDFDGALLLPGETYTICELMEHLNTVAWTVNWSYLIEGDAGPPIPINPADIDVDPTTGDQCYDFTAGVGEKIVFYIDNISPPGGEPRTPGYWKNWNWCSNGNQAEKTFEKRQAGERLCEDGFCLVEDLIDPPLVIGELTLGLPTSWNPASPTCTENVSDIVSLLNMRDIREGLKPKDQNMTSDPAYKLARNLIAAELNYRAGACTTPGVTQAMAEAYALLDDIDFNGAGTQVNKKSADGILANQLAGYLDDYNNGVFCP